MNSLAAIKRRSRLLFTAFICRGLNTPWATTRYAAALALLPRLKHKVLHPATLEVLRVRLGKQEPYAIRLTTAYILTRCGVDRGIDTLLHLILPPTPDVVRKAALFSLAAAAPLQLTYIQQEEIMHRLLLIMHEHDPEIVSQAAHTLSNVIGATALPLLYDLLREPLSQHHLTALQAIEHLAGRSEGRKAIKQSAILSSIVPFCQSSNTALRRQACLALAACGGEYPLAVMGTIIHTQDHPGRVEAIDALPHLFAVLHAPLRTRVTTWLLSLLAEDCEIIQVAVLDTLATLLWQARKRQKRAWYDLCHMILEDGQVFPLLTNTSAWIRQRAIELLMPLGGSPLIVQQTAPILTHVLRSDDDSSVRACAAYTSGYLRLREMLPSLLMALLDQDPYVALTALHAIEQSADAHDSIVSSVLRELTYMPVQSEPQHVLCEETQRLLQKWHRVKRDKPISLLPDLQESQFTHH